MNENAILLRNWTTTGILQLIEEGKLKDAPRLEDPLRDMWNNIEQTNPEKWSFALKDGRKVSPIDIQRYYLGKLEGISDGKRDRQALRLLERVLGLLERRKTREAAHLVEWVDRYLAIQEHAGKDEKGGPEAEMTACKRYSELSEGRSLYHERVRRGLVDRQLSDAEILKAITAPPPDTRAALRSKILDGFEVRSMDWSRVTIREGQHSREIWLNDPFESDREAI
jgi:proteasome accessory factor A